MYSTTYTEASACLLGTLARSPLRIASATHSSTVYNNTLASACCIFSDCNHTNYARLAVEVLARNAMNARLHNEGGCSPLTGILFARHHNYPSCNDPVQADRIERRVLMRLEGPLANEGAARDEKSIDTALKQCPMRLCASCRSFESPAFVEATACLLGDLTRTKSSTITSAARFPLLALLALGLPTRHKPFGLWPNPHTRAGSGCAPCAPLCMDTDEGIFADCSPELRAAPPGRLLSAFHRCSQRRDTLTGTNARAITTLKAAQPPKKLVEYMPFACPFPASQSASYWLVLLQAGDSS